MVTSSLGYTDWYQWKDFNGQVAPITKAVNAAVERGLFIVNSAGNSNFQGIGAPADSFGVVAVGAVTSNGSPASFTSRGPSADGRIKPEICAMGSGTYCANPHTTAYKSCSGTSFSTPLMAGVASLILSAHPTWKPWQVREALIRTAGTPDAPTYYCGFGIANALAAINFIQPHDNSCGTNSNCSGHGTCENGICKCNSEFYWYDCSFQRASCSDWCKHGSCNQDGVCSCQSGYSGIYCSCQGTTCSDVQVPWPSANQASLRFSSNSGSTLVIWPMIAFSALLFVLIV